MTRFSDAFTLGFSLIFLWCCAQESNETNHIKNLNPGVNEIKIDQIINGKNTDRSVYVKTPSNGVSKKTPLVFVFHGAGGHGAQFLNDATLNELIEAKAFVGVFPNGHRDNGGDGGFWNLGSEPTSADDIAFLDLIFEALSSYSNLDFSNAFAIGFSNGAGMTNLIGKKSQYFKAIAPLFSQQITNLKNINPPRTLSVLQVNGANDPMIPIDGGQSHVGHFLPALESFENWANNAQCTGSYKTGSTVWGTTNLEMFTYESCNEATKIKYLIALDTQHGWNNSSTRASAYKEIWNFFQDLMD